MKTQNIKIGTRQEIIDYITKEYPYNDCYTRHEDPAKIIDGCINAGSPLVSISRTIFVTVKDVPSYKTVREQFIVTDYSDIKLQREMDRIDDNALRDRRIDFIKMLMEVEMDATERWNRILKVVDDFRNVDIPFNYADKL